MKTKQANMWKIKTPYGVKNWAYVKKCFDSHYELLEALEEVLAYDKDVILPSTLEKINKAIAKAKGVEIWNTD